MITQIYIFISNPNLCKYFKNKSGLKIIKKKITNKDMLCSKKIHKMYKIVLIGFFLETNIHRNSKCALHND